MEVTFPNAHDLRFALQAPKCSRMNNPSSVSFVVCPNFTWPSSIGTEALLEIVRVIGIHIKIPRRSVDKRDGSDESLHAMESGSKLRGVVGVCLSKKVQMHCCEHGFCCRESCARPSNVRAVAKPHLNVSERNRWCVAPDRGESLRGSTRGAALHAKDAVQSAARTSPDK